jgi:membrane protease YdiL (CAAX protease family)
VAISAGITEEILYRGFLTCVLVTSFPTIGIWLSIVVTACLFGLGHLYQGVSGMLRTFVLGLIMSLSYGATGTLLETPESVEPSLAQISVPN